MITRRTRLHIFQKKADNLDFDMIFKLKYFLIFAIVCYFATITVTAKKADPKNKPDWAKKDIRDFDDADLERLLDQWEVICN